MHNTGTLHYPCKTSHNWAEIIPACFSRFLFLGHAEQYNQNEADQLVATYAGYGDQSEKSVFRPQQV